MFQRKGAPTAAVDSSEAGDASLEGSTRDNKAAPSDGGPEPMTCPNCQCEFDPSSGEILNTADYDEGEAGAVDLGMADTHPMPDGMMPTGGL